MIRIQLAPAEETENPLWFLPELVMIVIFSGVSWFAADLFATSLKDDISQIYAEIDQSNAAYKTLSNELKRFRTLEEDIERLKAKIAAVQGITTSKITRYKPVILFEHLQNLKPNGVWFQYVKDDSANQTIQLVGKAFNNLLVAEFMSLLKSTKNQEADPSDLRSLVYFEEVTLDRISSIGNTGDPESVAQNQNPDLQSKQSTILKSYWEAGNGLFPEFERTPTFQLTLNYAERKIEAGPVTLSEL